MSLSDKRQVIWDHINDDGTRWNNQTRGYMEEDVHDAVKELLGIVDRMLPRDDFEPISNRIRKIFGDKLT